ncbi:hypothetical protein ACFL5Q_01140 [Planctomycetota bacterium]
MCAQNLSEKDGLAGSVIFVRTALGVLLVACLIALGGLGYRLWQVNRQLSIRVKALEQHAASTEAALAEIRGLLDEPSRPRVDEATTVPEGLDRTPASQQDADLAE